MKQGRASRDVSESHKREPIASAKNPVAVAQLGVTQPTKGKTEKLYAGRGYEAPMNNSSTHKAGSQGKH